MHSHHGPHGHTHDSLNHAGHFHDRERRLDRDFSRRAFTVGVGGPVGSGKTALLLQLCRRLRPRLEIAVVTNDIFTKETASFSSARRHSKPNAFAPSRLAVARTRPFGRIFQRTSSLWRNSIESFIGHLLIESGGDNLAACFSRELADYTIQSSTWPVATKSRAKAARHHTERSARHQ